MSQDLAPIKTEKLTGIIKPITASELYIEHITSEFILDVIRQYSQVFDPSTVLQICEDGLEKVMCIIKEDPNLFKKGENENILDTLNLKTQEAPEDSSITDLTGTPFKQGISDL